MKSCCAEFTPRRSFHAPACPTEPHEGEERCGAQTGKRGPSSTVKPSFQKVIFIRVLRGGAGAVGPLAPPDFGEGRGMNGSGHSNQNGNN